MKELLQTLEQILRNLNAPVLSYFNPPLEQDEQLISFVRSKMGNVVIPDELIELYRWHNGTQFLVDSDVRPTFFADELCLCNFDIIGETIDSDNVYNYTAEKLLPIFTSYFGENLAIDLKDQSRKLIFCSTSDFEIPSKISKYDNLQSFLKTIIEQFNSKCLIYDNTEGVIGLDFEKYDEYMQIGERLNLHSDYWRVKREFQEGSSSF